QSFKHPAGNQLGISAFGYADAVCTITAAINIPNSIAGCLFALEIGARDCVAGFSRSGQDYLKSCTSMFLRNCHELFVCLVSDCELPVHANQHNHCFVSNDANAPTRT